MNEYVAGFMFNYDKTQTLLVLKDKPAWQKGKLNAIGGRIEAGEPTLVAMCREFKEETGLDTYDYLWQYKLTLKGPDWVVYFFIYYTEFADLKCLLEHKYLTKKIEPICPMLVSLVNKNNSIPNLPWIIPLCLDKTIKFPIVIEDTVP